MGVYPSFLINTLRTRPGNGSPVPGLFFGRCRPCTLSCVSLITWAPLPVDHPGNQLQELGLNEILVDLGQLVIPSRAGGTTQSGYRVAAVYAHCLVVMPGGER